MSITSQSHRNARKFRIVFLGDQDVGKTSIIERYTSGRFDETYNSTVGIDFNVKDVNRNGAYYRLQMWDTAGQERYRSLIPTYLKNANSVVFVFDVTKSKSFQSLQMWCKLFSDYQEAPGIIVANKIDLTGARKVNRNEGEEISKKLGMKYLEVSAKTGKKINQLFDIVIDMINQYENYDELVINQNNTQGKMAQQNMVSDKIELKPPTFKEKIMKKCCQSS